MSIVQLNGSLFWEILPSSFSVFFKSSDDILKSGANEEILLFQSEFFSFIGRVIRIQHTGNILSSLSGFNGLVIVSFIETIEIKFIGWN